MNQIFRPRRTIKFRALLLMTFLATVILFLANQPWDDDNQAKPFGAVPEIAEIDKKVVGKLELNSDMVKVLPRQTNLGLDEKVHPNEAITQSVFSRFTSSVNSSKSPGYFAYFHNRTRPITDYNHEFIVPSTPCNSRTPTFLVILCLSKYNHVTSRIAIRNTWGSVSRTNIWPRTNAIFSDVRLLFVLGRSDLNKSEKEAFEKEDKDYGDIIVSDFNDSYYNLTRKVIVGLKWVEMFCKHAQFVLKVDEDTFIHVANMVSYLKSSKTQKSSVVMGHMYIRPPVLRKGRWGVSKSIYPFDFFPPYVSGNSYVISADIISEMITAMTYLPYMFIEDAAITGIARVGVNASIVNNYGFTYFAKPPPRLCDLHSKYIKSATKTSDSFKQELWKALHWPLWECKQMATSNLQYP